MEYIGNDRLKELRPRKKKNKWLGNCIVLVILCCVATVILWYISRVYKNTNNVETKYVLDLKNVEPFDDQPFAVLNSNIPYFLDSDKVVKPFEIYSDLDGLGRCGVAYANISKDTMPTEERGEIGSVKPSGWHTVKYNDLIEGNYLYNRCHLIAFCLAGENANELNLITGTRYLNVEGMLPFELQVAQYVEKTGNHVLYRVTPIFEGNNLVASGVQIEAWSVEDNGQGVCFNVYCYNIQPGIEIDYMTGDSWREK